jgi:hypothetical protein
MAESIRKQLVIKLLEEGNLSVRQIAEKVDCTTGYVYNIRCELGLRKIEAKKADELMASLNKQLESIVKPKAFSHDWQPTWWQMLAMVVGAGSALYFILVVAMSF